MKVEQFLMGVQGAMFVLVAAMPSWVVGAAFITNSLVLLGIVVSNKEAETNYDKIEKQIKETNSRLDGLALSFGFQPRQSA